MGSRRRLGGTFAEQMREPGAGIRLRKTAVIFATILGRLGARDKILLLGLRAGVGGELTRFRLDCFLNHARRRIECGGVHIGRERDGALHEFSPDRSGGLAAGESEVAVVVKSDPYNAKQIGGESCEPAVMRGAGL